MNQIKPTLLVLTLILFPLLIWGCGSKSETAQTPPEPSKTVLPADILPPEFARIIFFGDSITRAGVEPNGYVTLVQETLKQEYPNHSVEVIGSGVNGHKVPNLQARLQKDVIAKKPTHVVIYIGINDVWHFYDSRKEPGTEKQEFEQGLQDLIAKIQKSGAEVLLCTPSVVGEDPNNDTKVNQLLIEYAEISRTVAKTAGIKMCDLRLAFEEYLQKNNPNKDRKGILTFDGVHLNDQGNRFVADIMLDHLRPLITQKIEMETKGNKETDL